MAKAWFWLTGKKTYLLTGVILTAAFALLVTGRLTPSATMTLILIAVGGFPSTLRAAFAKHQADVLSLLAMQVVTAKDIAAKNLPQVAIDVERTAVSGIALATAIQADLKAEAQSR